MVVVEDALVPVRWRDLPALALVAGQAMGRRPFGVALAWVLALVIWPMSWVILVLQFPQLWHVRWRAVVAIRPPDASIWPGVRPLLLGPGALGTVIGLSWYLAHPLFWALVTTVAFGLLVYAGPYPGRLPAGPKVEHPSTPVRISTAAAIRRGSGLLGKTRDQVRAQYPGVPVELIARDANLVELYTERLGVRQVTPGRGRMIGEASR